MYGTGINIWVVGCILAELLLRILVFPRVNHFGSTDENLYGNGNTYRRELASKYPILHALIL